MNCNPNRRRTRRTFRRSNQLRVGELLSFERLEDRLCLSGFSFVPAPGSPFPVFPVGSSNPQTVIVGDFNGDLKPDLATANSGSNNVGVLLGNALDGFGPGAGFAFPPGTGGPISLAAGDFNGDLKLDLVTGTGGNTVSVLLGDGAGGFSLAAGSPVTLGGAAAIVSLVVADFNNDGKPDVATANLLTLNVSVLLGDGSGGLTAAAGSPIALGVNPNALAVGDFNGDLKPDLATANSGSNNVSVLLGDGLGGFAPAVGSPFAVSVPIPPPPPPLPPPPPVNFAPVSLVIDDFDGDGRADIATANNGSGNVSVLLNNPLGGFAPALGSPFFAGIPSPRSIAVADFDGDNILDLATANDSFVSVLTGNGVGQFTQAPPAFSLGGMGAASMAVADFNVDGRIDLATANSSSNNVSVLLNRLPQQNQPPFAVDDLLTVQENSAGLAFVVGNDFDLDGFIDINSIVITQAPSHGTLGTPPGFPPPPPGFVVYTPNPGYVGPDSFDYTVRDNAGAVSNEAIVRLNVVPNQPPLAVDDSATVRQNTPTSVFVVGNDSDPDGFIDVFSVAITQPPAHGVVATFPAVPPGLVQYTANPGYVGPDSFAYTVHDNAGAVSNQAIVSLNIVPNQPPVAVDDSVTLKENSNAFVFVIGNDSDPDGSIDSNSVVITQPPSHGTLGPPPGLPFPGLVFYTPNTGYVGPDSFAYTVRDDSGAVSNEAIVTLNIVPNQPPLAVDDSATVQQDTPTSVFVVGNDSDPDGSIDFASIVITQPPSHGTVALPPAIPFPPGFLVYTPNPGYAGPDSFAYTVRDDSGAVSNEALVRLNVVANQPPVAVDDSATVKENSLAFVFVVGNDFDPDGFIDLSSVVITQPPSHGTLGGPPGLVIYTPNPGYVGPDSFAYTVRDIAGAVSNEAIVRLNVVANQPPVARDDGVQIMIGQLAGIDVLGNDSDPDGIISPSTLAIQQPPSHGSVTVDPFSRIALYTPDCDFVGSDSFTYTVRDNDGAESNVATVTIDVAAAALSEFGELQVSGTCKRDIVRIEPEGDLLVVHALLGMPSEGRMPSSGSTSQIAAPRNPNELRLEFSLAGVHHIFVSAGAGNDQVTIAPTISLPSFMDGGEGDDWLRTGSGDDTVFDFSGDNRIETGNGRDFIAAGGLLPIGNGNNRIDAGAGDDVVVTFGGDDSIDAGPGNDLIDAGPGNNRIDAGSGDDTVTGGNGNDWIDAGPGNDIVHAGGGNDTVEGGFGNDIVLGEDGNDTVSGGVGRDLLIGGLGADHIVGNQDDDILIAGTTAPYFNDSALRAILAEWTSDRTYDERMANLTTGIGPPALGIRLNGDAGAGLLQTVFEDNDVDVLSGNQARDWFFANLVADNGGPLDQILDKAANEVWTDTDLII